MKFISPTVPIYQAVTLSGNPLAMKAGYAVLRKIADDTSLYDRLESFGKQFDEGVAENLKAVGRNFYTTRLGSMAGIFFTEQKVVDIATALTSDTALYS